ncbi:hypothetical protein L249_7431, partial [Ophiocordyceps polyrhachis-furcata BCC 54312]
PSLKAWQKSISSRKEEGGKKEVKIDKELTNREGNYVIEKKKRNHVIVRTLPRCKRCA